MTKPVYLDYNATTPHDPEVIEAMRPYLETEFGNPSSSHWYGYKPKKAVEKARQQVARLLNCDLQEVIFTSGGTESNNFAIKGIAFAMQAGGNHIITSLIEHPAVLEVCHFLERHGFEITYLPVDREGLVKIKDIEEAIRPETILISIMHANNEIGTIQPIAEIASIAKAHDIIFHTDAAQSVGKIPTDVIKLGVGCLSLAGHKIYAPKGVGVLYARRPLKLQKFCHGAGQEMGRRAGTENVLEIVGLGKACQIAERDLQKNMAHMNQLRDRLQEGLFDSLKKIRLNGHPLKRLPNTLSVSFRGLQANRILDEISPLVAASAGAACHSDVVKISQVIQAIRLPQEWAMGTLRFSVGRMTTPKEIDHTIHVVVNAVKKLAS